MFFFLWSLEFSSIAFSLSPWWTMTTHYTLLADCMHVFALYPSAARTWRRRFWRLQDSHLICRAPMLAFEQELHDSDRLFNGYKHSSGVQAAFIHRIHGDSYLLFLFIGRKCRLVEVFLHYQTPGCCMWTRRTTQFTILLHFDPNVSRMPAHHFFHSEFLVSTSTPMTGGLVLQSDARICRADQ